MRFFYRFFIFWVFCALPFLSPCTATSLSKSASSPTATTPNSVITSLGDLDSICIGTIHGRPDQVFVFKRYLKNQLASQNFNVLDNQANCNATLEGELFTELENIRPVGFLRTGSWAKILATAKMQLLNTNHQVVWQKDFKPYLALKSPDYIKNDGKSGCATNIAKEIKKSKLKALH